jgi:undecaprenyl-diphosphatase
MDGAIYRWVNRLANRTGWAHGILKLNAGAGAVLFAVLLLACYLDSRRHDDITAVTATIWTGAAALVALGIGQLIGHAVNRARPYEHLADIHLLVDRTNDVSFPSDHATVAGAVAVGLLLVNRKWGIVATVLAVIMAFTRVYVGAHYPTDVIGGLALGGIVAAAGYYLLVPRLARATRRLSESPIRPLLVRSRVPG